MPAEDSLEDEYQVTPFGMKQAAIAAGLLPALQLQTALASAFALPGNLLLGISASIKGDWDQAAKYGMDALHMARQAAYFSGAFVLNCLKEVTAFITRSIATLVDMCKGTASTESRNHGNSSDDGASTAAAEVHGNCRFNA